MKQSGNKPKDSELVRRFIEGDASAFDEIFNKYQKALIFSASKITGSETEAKEIVQDVFIKFWDYQHKLNPDISLRPYLYKMIKNKALDQLKALARRKELVQKYQATRLYRLNRHTEDMVELAELERKLLETLDNLTNQQKEIFLLCQEAKPIKEIAAITGLAEKTVRNNIYEIKKIIKEGLK